MGILSIMQCKVVLFCIVVVLLYKVSQIIDKNRLRETVGKLVSYKYRYS